MSYKIILIALLFICSSLGLQAQKQVGDIIHLENGDVIHGEVLEYNPKENIKIKILGGSILVYKSSEVLKIEKGEIESIATEVVEARPPHIKEKGVYHTIMGNTIFFVPNWGSMPAALGTEYSVGYHFHRLFGLGGGIGINTYYYETFVPIYANVRGYLFKTSTSMYYDLNIGYGLNVSSLTWMGTRVGGLYARPAIGVRFASTKKAHLAMDLGCNIQMGGVHEYARYSPSLRLGVTF